MWLFRGLQANGNGGPFGGVMVDSPLFIFFMVLGIAIFAAIAAGLWKLYEKAGQPGWTALIPFYNDYIRVQIVGLPQKWFYYVLLLSILTNFFSGGIDTVAQIALLVLNFYIMRPFLRAFGQPDTTANTILYVLLPFIMYPRLGFGPATYQGLPSLHDVPNLPWIDGGSSSATPPTAQPTHVPPVIGGPSDSGSGDAGSFIPTMGHNDKKDNNQQ